MWAEHFTTTLFYISTAVCKWALCYKILLSLARQPPTVPGTNHQAGHQERKPLITIYQIGITTYSVNRLIFCYC